MISSQTGNMKHILKVISNCGSAEGSPRVPIHSILASLTSLKYIRWYLSNLIIPNLLTELLFIRGWIEINEPSGSIHHCLLVMRVVLKLESNKWLSTPSLKWSQDISCFENCLLQFRFLEVARLFSSILSFSLFSGFFSLCKISLNITYLKIFL